jgi:hypothetical protein
LDDAHEDVRAAAIWALSEVGGEGVRSHLEAMQEDTEDEDEADLIESALENLSFAEDFQKFAILDVDEADDAEDDDYLDEDDYDEDDLLDDLIEEDDEEIDGEDADLG